MKQDSLHLLNDILTAIEHLKTDLKPAPKTFVEQYGIIIGASLAIMGSLIIFWLNVLRDDRNREKERIKLFNDLRRTIYGDAIKYQSSFVKHVRQYYRHKIHLLYLYRKYKIETDEESKTKIQESIDEFREKMNEQNQLFLEEYKNYISALGQYRFIKEGNSEITVHIDKFANGIKIDIDSDFKSLNTKAELDEYRKTELEKMFKTWWTEIKTPTENAIEHILKNT